MKLRLREPQSFYKSGSQTARVVTEAWIAESLYCPNCGNSHLNQFPPNQPVADFFCGRCDDQYEVKSQKKNFGKKIVNGAYKTKVKRLKTNTSPNLILMNYDPGEAVVRSVLVVPKRFFVPAIVEKRKPLGPGTKRAGWVGSNILISKIPESGRIFLVKDGIIESKEYVLSRWQKTAFLDRKSQSARGWLIEVMGCVDRLDPEGFSLHDVYQYETHLGNLYPGNKNVRPKIRQQLQVLRDNGYLKFLGSGRYCLN